MNDTKMITLRIPTRTADTLKLVAEATHTTTNSTIRTAIDQHLHAVTHDPTFSALLDGIRARKAALAEAMTTANKTAP